MGCFKHLQSCRYSSASQERASLTRRVLRDPTQDLGRLAQRCLTSCYSLENKEVNPTGCETATQTNTRECQPRESKEVQTNHLQTASFNETRSQDTRDERSRPVSHTEFDFGARTGVRSAASSL